MAFWEEFPQIPILAWGKLEDRPDRPEHKQHGFFSYDTCTFWLVNNDRRWVYAGGSFPRNLNIELLVTSNEQVITHEIQLETGGALLLEDGAAVILV